MPADAPETMPQDWAQRMENPALAHVIGTTAPILKIAVSGACLVGLALAAVTLVSSRERNAPAATSIRAPEGAAVPAIDAAAPARTETATFALG